MAANTYLYNMYWEPRWTALEIEINFCRHGGYIEAKGLRFGNGLLFHFKRVISLLWPQWVWHKWSDLFVALYLEHRTLVVIGASSTGKTACAAICALTDYYLFPECTTILCCSTEKEMLEQRIWGEIKALHRTAKLRAMVPGHLIEGRMRMVTDSKDEAEEGRDFRNGLLGVALKKGGQFVGLSSFIGVKNKRVRLFCDELHLCNRVVVDSISNLDKNPDFKAVGLGNPKDTTDALGIMGEPAATLGGWDGGLDQEPVTKFWKTRRPEGVCLQYVGTDSPNLDGKLGIPLITQEAIDRDIAEYGRDSWQFWMMDQGVMPKGQGNRRVLTRQLCDKFGARNMPIWRSTKRTKIASLDAAYRGVGGDRCILAFSEFGQEAAEDESQKITDAMQSGLVYQMADNPSRRTLFAIVEVLLVPVNPTLTEPAEDQIASFVRNACEYRGVAPENFFFDAGMRTSLVTAFARLWSTAVNSLDFMGSASQEMVSADIQVRACDYYYNRITEVWYSVRLCVESGQFRGMPETMMNEFCQREWCIAGKNKIQVEPKDKMKQKVGRSPDEADCGAIALLGAIQKGFIIRKLKPKDEPEQDESWKHRLTQESRAVETGKLLNYSA